MATTTIDCFRKGAGQFKLVVPEGTELPKKGDLITLVEGGDQPENLQVYDRIYIAKFLKDSKHDFEVVNFSLEVGPPRTSETRVTEK